MGGRKHNAQSVRVDKSVYYDGSLAEAAAAGRTLGRAGVCSDRGSVQPPVGMGARYSKRGVERERGGRCDISIQH